MKFWMNLNVASAQMRSIHKLKIISKKKRKMNFFEGIWREEIDYVWSVPNHCFSNEKCFGKWTFRWFLHEANQIICQVFGCLRLHNMRRVESLWQVWFSDSAPIRSQWIACWSFPFTWNMCLFELNNFVVCNNFKKKTGMLNISNLFSKNWFDKQQSISVVYIPQKEKTPKEHVETLVTHVCS